MRTYAGMSGFFDDMMAGGQAPNAGNLLNDVLSEAGGVQGLLGKFEQSGFGDHVRSWIGDGAKSPISPEQIERVIPPERLHQLAQAHGVPAGTVSILLAHLLPHAVNAASHDGAPG